MTPLWQCSQGVQGGVSCLQLGWEPDKPSLSPTLDFLKITTPGGRGAERGRCWDRKYRGLYYRWLAGSWLPVPKVGLKGAKLCKANVHNDILLGAVVGRKGKGAGAETPWKFAWRLCCPHLPPPTQGHLGQGMKEGEGGTDFLVWSILNLLQDPSSTGGGRKSYDLCSKSSTVDQPLTDAVPGYHCYHILTVKILGGEWGWWTLGWIIKHFVLKWQEAQKSMSVGRTFVLCDFSLNRV